MNIKEALMQMDALDDEQWTADYAPKLAVLIELVGGKVSRQDIVDAAPEFTRNNMVVLETPKEPEDTKEPEVTEEEAIDLSIIEAYLNGDPLTEQEFIGFLSKVKSMQLPALEQVLVEQLDEAVKAINLAQDLRNRLKLSLAYTRGRVKREIPDMSNQEAIQTFIASQAKARAAKIMKTREILQGIDLKSLDPRAAIDRAMSRKNTRGTKRPVRM